MTSSQSIVPNPIMTPMIPILFLYSLKITMRLNTSYFPTFLMLFLLPVDCGVSLITPRENQGI